MTKFRNSVQDMLKYEIPALIFSITYITLTQGTMSRPTLDSSNASSEDKQEYLKQHYRQNMLNKNESLENLMLRLHLMKTIQTCDQILDELKESSDLLEEKMNEYNCVDGQSCFKEHVYSHELAHRIKASNEKASKLQQEIKEMFKSPEESIALLAKEIQSCSDIIDEFKYNSDSLENKMSNFTCKDGWKCFKLDIYPQELVYRIKVANDEASKLQNEINETVLPQIRISGLGEIE